MLHRWCTCFYKLKTRHSASKKMITYFIVILTLLWWSGTKATICPRYAYNSSACITPKLIQYYKQTLNILSTFLSLNVKAGCLPKTLDPSLGQIRICLILGLNNLTTCKCTLYCCVKCLNKYKVTEITSSISYNKVMYLYLWVSVHIGMLV